MNKHRKNIRLRNYDYKQDGAYFITICTNYRKPLIKDDENKIITIELKSIEDRFHGVFLDFLSVMDNHIHFILIFKEAEKSLPDILRAFKSRTTYMIKKNGFPEKIFWQRNYYEHIIRNESALERIRTYIANNPLSEQLKWEEIYRKDKSSKLDHYKSK